MGFNHDLPDQLKVSPLDQLARSIFDAECPGIRYTEHDVEPYRRAALAALRELHAPIEPVAYRWRLIERCEWNVQTEAPSLQLPNAIVVQPLYTYFQLEDWRLIDTAPKDGNTILGYSDEGVSYVCWWDGNGWCFFRDHRSGRHYFEPTHWMPHPPLPPASSPVSSNNRGTE